MIVTVTADPVVEICQASVWLDTGLKILADIDWTILPGEQWALLGPNGSGKSTLMSLAGAVRHPSHGDVTILGGRVGKVSMWDLRERIGMIDPSQKMLDWLTIEEIVLTGATGTIYPLPDRLGPAEHKRAAELLAMLDCSNLAERDVTTLSQGERQRVRIARALMSSPPLLLLDEPATGLDLPSREALLQSISTMAREHPEMATVMVSHHLEELPPTTTHALLLRDGKTIAIGNAVDVLNSELITETFGFPVKVHYEDGRWSARATANWHTRR
jgi:iron complex transport system ATP-binding protein